MGRRFILRVELTAAAKRKVAELSDHYGMTQVAMMSRLTTWFSEQNRVIQAATLDQFPKAIRKDVAKLILARFYDEKK